MATETIAPGGEKREEKGILVPLKTCKELASRDKVIDVWVVGLDNIRNASQILSLIHTLFPGDGDYDFNHLRRVAKLGDVPQSLRTAYDICKVSTFKVQSLNKDGLESSSPSFHPEDLRSKGQLNTDIPSITKSTVQSFPSLCSGPNISSRLIIVCPVETISLESLGSMLSSSADIDFSNPIIISASVPLLAPTSTAQAKAWSESHWPTIYKKNNPFGPHPSIVSRAQIEILSEASRWMELAWSLAKEAKASGRGEGIGVVVVKRSKGSSSGRVISVAGDARWLGWPSEHKIIKGNPAAHAVMRAIAIVATATKYSDLEEKKRDTTQATTLSPSPSCCCMSPKSNATDEQREASIDMKPIPEITSPSFSFPSSSSSIFHEQALSIMEQKYNNKAYHVNDRQDEDDGEKGYLCHGLEIYCTHEPCVMCSMAMVHSRFTRVVFEKRMYSTGGLTADGLLGYGLFWRKELNWTMLAWQWRKTITTNTSTSATVESITSKEHLDNNHEMEDLQV